MARDCMTCGHRFWSPDTQSVEERLFCSTSCMEEWDATGQAHCEVCGKRARERRCIEHYYNDDEGDQVGVDR